MKKESIYFLFTTICFLAACNNVSRKNIQTDTPSKGTIHISVDESFRPVIEQEIKVYESSFKGAKIIAEYKPEVDCFKDLQSDSTRMVIIARGLKENEIRFYENKLSYQPQFGILAYDAVAAIVNINSKDSVFTMAELKDILSGKRNKTVVMDGNNATSTVRYLQDSILHDAPFGKNVMATGGSDSVVSVISKTENAIGFVGISWVGNPDEPAQVANLKKIRLALLECVKCKEKGLFAKPSQATITYGEYPLARPLYYILKENALGLGTGFMNFMSLERGQLIFRSGGIAPAKMNLIDRSSKIKE